ncbi:MAG TPA: hypothetical protein VMW01_06295 [Williamwhitmania sp.]|nr:hypothetical protein [Williamwhitmania sp.]
MDRVLVKTKAPLFNAVPLTFDLSSRIEELKLTPFWTAGGLNAIKFNYGR